jgi:uncharacterized protein YjbI with pentapeptide repeats
MTNTDLSFSIFDKSDFRNTNLIWSNFNWTWVVGVNFSWAIMDKDALKHANLTI